MRPNFHERGAFSCVCRNRTQPELAPTRGGFVRIPAVRDNSPATGASARTGRICPSSDQWPYSGYVRIVHADVICPLCARVRRKSDLRMSDSCDEHASSLRGLGLIVRDIHPHPLIFMRTPMPSPPDAPHDALTPSPHIAILRCPQNHIRISLLSPCNAMPPAI